MQQQSSDRIGGAAAVVHQIVDVAVAILAHVLHEGVEQVAKQPQWQAVAGDRRAQAKKYRMLCRFAAFNRVQFGLIAGEQRAALLRRKISLVGEIVGAAGEAINCRHRLAQGRRQQNGRNRKVFVVINGHAKDRRQRTEERILPALCAVFPVPSPVL